MRDDTTRLRVLLTTLDLPLRLEEPDTIVGANDACGAVGFFVSTHAPGFVAAVNALPGLLDRVEAAEARVAELEAIIAGRTTPTDAEIAAHDGVWIITGPHAAGYPVRCVGPEEAREIRTTLRGAWVWTPWRSSLGRPCAWPTAEVSRG